MSSFFGFLIRSWTLLALHDIVTVNTWHLSGSTVLTTFENAQQTPNSANQLSTASIKSVAYRPDNKYDDVTISNEGNPIDIISQQLEHKSNINSQDNLESVAYRPDNKYDDVTTSNEGNPIDIISQQLEHKSNINSQDNLVKNTVQQGEVLTTSSSYAGKEIEIKESNADNVTVDDQSQASNDTDVADEENFVFDVLLEMINDGILTEKTVKNCRTDKSMKEPCDILKFMLLAGLQELDSYKKFRDEIKMSAESGESSSEEVDES